MNQQPNPHTPQVVTPKSAPQQTNYDLPAYGNAKGWGIAGFILAIFLPLLGVIFSHISLSKFKKQQPQAGRGLAVAGAVIGWVSLVFYIIYAVLGIVTIMMLPTMNIT